MQLKQDNKLLEDIPHKTHSLPISFHHTVSSPETEAVLYLHWHNELEFLFILDGEADFFIEDQEYQLKAGNAIFIPPNLLHTAKRRSKSGCEFRAIVFSPALLSECFTNTTYVKYIQPVKNYPLRFPLLLTSDLSWQKEIIDMLESMYSLSQEAPASWELQMHGMLMMLWQWIFNNHISKVDVSSNITRLSHQLDESIQFIHNFYGDFITLEKLAALANLSEGQFCRLFKQLLGFTPFSYLNRYRIIKSCDYLRHSTKKVAEIATLCGFNNISHYNREFKKYIKVSPKDYRKFF